MFKILLLLMWAFPLLAQQNLQLINWFAGADVVATGDNIPKDNDDKSDALNDGMVVREFEFSAVSQIDQTWQGILTLAYHNELQMEEEHLEVHEALLFSSKLLPMANVKIGKFFLGFGRLNRFHRHDWIFTEAPMVQKSYFGNEGVKDTGFEYTRLIGGELNWKATIGLVAGNEFRHLHGDHEGEEEHDHEHGGIDSAFEPTRYFRISNFKEFSTLKGVETGLSYVERRNGEGTRYQYSGIDLIYKNRYNQYLDHLLQLEIWHRRTDEMGEEAFEDYGGYAYFEKGINRHHALGFRYEFYKPNHDDHEEAGHDHSAIDGLTPNEDYQALSFSYNYYNSEFMRTRLTLEHHTGVEVDEDDVQFQRLHLQFVFNIGAHPAHIY
jgi:hypothetical protein